MPIQVTHNCLGLYASYESLQLRDHLLASKTVAKVCVNHSSLKQAKDLPQCLMPFGKEALSEAMRKSVETLLARIILTHFFSTNDCHVHRCHRMKRLDFAKPPPTQSSIHLYIK
jgi:hypothetical protein